MEFIDRTHELERLRTRLAASVGNLIVIYGRRRLGKSTLIRRILTDGDVYYMAENNEPAMQMTLLQNAVAEVCPEFVGMTFDSWEGLLLMFNRVCRHGATLVLDEFPYLVSATPSLPSTLQRLIDGKALRFNLIICGSSQRMMHNLVLNASEPLYGRASERILLQPIDVSYWRDAFSLTADQAITEFSVWGGVPRYWELRAGERNFIEAVHNLVLDPNGVLYDEPAALFLDESNGVPLFSSIMNALGSGHCHYSRLANAVGKKTTELSVPLRRLIEMAYIEKEVPFGVSEQKTRQTLYRIADPFMAFYYKFVAPNKSLLAIGRRERVDTLVQERFAEHAGVMWERLCRRAVSGNRLLGDEWQMARRWWGKSRGGEPLEFDVVAESADGKTLLVGECKWTAPDYAARLYAELRRKVSLAPFVGNRRVVCALFLRSEALDAAAGIPILYPDDILRLL